MFFLASLCFYFLCMCLRIRPWVAVIGGLAFAYSTTFPQFITAGHDTQMLALAYAPAVLGGVILLFDKKYISGFIMTALFAGLFETMSQERSQIIQGIKHFNGRQDSLSQRIQEGWKQLDDLDPSSADPKVVEQRIALQQTIDWDSRVFDDREHLLPVICQQPTVIEQRLFALSRAIQEDIKAPQ
jgi:hypothetical protein